MNRTSSTLTRLFVLSLSLFIAAPVLAQTHLEPIVWDTGASSGEMSDPAPALEAIDAALQGTPSVFVSGGGVALATAINDAAPGTLLEVTDSMTYDAVTISGKSGLYIRAAQGESPAIQSEALAGSVALAMTGANVDIGLQGFTFLVGALNHVGNQSLIGAVRYSNVGGGTSLERLLIQDCDFEPLHPASGAVVAIQLTNDSGNVAGHRDIVIRRSRFDSTGTVAAQSQDLAAITVTDFEDVLISNNHLLRTSTISPSQMRGIRANIVGGLVEFLYCDDIGTGQSNECVKVSGATGFGLGSLTDLDVVVRNSAVREGYRGFRLEKAASTLVVEHSVVVTGVAERTLRNDTATSGMTIRDSIFVQTAGTSQLLNPNNGAFSTDHNVYSWAGALGFTPDATDLVGTDPFLSDPASGDFTLQGGSVATGSGSGGDDRGILYVAPFVGCANDAECDDGVACNGAETCDLDTGLCGEGTPVVCEGACLSGVCEEPSGSCAPATDGTACDLGGAVVCSIDDACLGGLCQPGAGGTDADDDAVCDVDDSCPVDADPDQSDVDADGVGDACDLDTTPSSFVVNRILMRFDTSATRDNGRLIVRAFLNDNDSGGAVATALLSGVVELRVSDVGSFAVVVPLQGCATASGAGTVRCVSADGSVHAAFRRMANLGPNLYRVILTAARLAESATGAVIPVQPVTVVLDQGTLGRTDTLADCEVVGASALRCTK